MSEIANDQVYLGLSRNRTAGRWAHAKSSFCPTDIPVDISGSNPSLEDFFMTFMLTYQELEARNARLEHQVNQCESERQTLQQRAQGWQHTFDAMMDLVMVIDARYHVVRANKATARAFNRPVEDILGRKYWEIYGQDHPVAGCPLILAEKSLRAHTKELALTNLGGTFLISASVIVGKNGHFLGYCLTLKEMSVFRRRQRQQQQEDKMDAISTLSGGIAHEFNNLLTGIQGTISMILAGMNRHSPDYKKLQRVESYVETGHELTKQLLGFGIDNTYEVKPTDLNILVEKMWDEVIAPKDGIQGKQSLEDGLWLSNVDGGQIEQVLSHLFMNAREAMPAGGELHIETENVVFDQNYADFFGVPQGDYVKITLTDTGEGMDYAVQEKIFDPFFTTRPQCTGLGLTFAQRIVVNHGGLINIYSENGRGTAVNIYLPASSGKARLEKETGPNQVLTGTETVLLVDDERMILEVGGEMLRELGYHVHLANSGPEAVHIYGKQGTDIDLVILDMIMPDMDGRKTYDRLREINPDIKVLLASGYSITSQVSEILTQGFSGFIQKPFNLIRLSKKMRAILAQ